MGAKTIFALSTPAGRGGVAVVRISGPHAAGVLTALCSSLPAPRRTSLRQVRDPATGQLIDDALVFWHEGPGSFTGEDLAEIQVHGSLAVVKLLLAVLARQPGLRLADPGEFARRAFLNGKLTLLQAEGLADIVRSNTVRQLRAAQFQTSGASSATVARWGQAVCRSLAWIEAVLDFSDDVPDGDKAVRSALAEAHQVHGEIRVELTRSVSSQKLREGFKVVLCGPPNSGKSSLFNRLSGAEMAIVDEFAGTTRDLIRAELDFDGVPVTLFDSAGIRSTGDRIEREGVRRALDLVGTADVIVWVDAPDVAAERPDHFDSVPIWIWNKADLGAPAPPGMVAVSCRTGDGLNSLREAIMDRLVAETGWGEPAVATRVRHRAKLEQAAAALAANETPGILLEIVAEHLRACLSAFDELMGRTTPEDILDVVFREFCIGK